MINKGNIMSKLIDHKEAANIISESLLNQIQSKSKYIITKNKLNSTYSKYVDFTDSSTWYEYRVDISSNSGMVWSTKEQYADFSIELESRDVNKLSSKSSKKHISLERVTEQFALNFAEDKIEKMFKSVNDRRAKIEAKNQKIAEARFNKHDRCTNWRLIMRDLPLVKGNNFFHDEALTTLNLKIDAGNDEMIAKVFAAVTGLSETEILDMYKLNKIK
jgi:hypothetical protein